MKLLKAGDFDLIYKDGFLHRILRGNDEILRMIYFAYRDENWVTLPLRVINENIESVGPAFTITYSAVNHRNNVNLIEWNCKITGDESGKITFSIQGKVLHELKRNRIGCCVLHPLKGVKDTTCEITDPQGKKTESRFPVEISPDTPFVDIASMKWKMKEDSYRLTFSGDIFETEDQRNWGDASFKTYCTPSRLPKPVTVKPGEEIRQEIMFEPIAANKKASLRPEFVTLTKSGMTVKIPLLGVSESSEVGLLSKVSIDQIKKIRFSHYRAEVNPSSPEWVAALSNSWQNAFSLGLPLELVVQLSPDNFFDELQAIMQLCEQNRVKLFSVLLLTKDKMVTDHSLLTRIADLRSTTKVKTGAGTNFIFTEINRNRFKETNFDFLSFSVHPQEHLADDLTVMENVEAHADIVQSAKALYGKDKPVYVSPVTLRRRFNPNSSDPAQKVKSNEQKSDPRQTTPFNAAWTFGSILSLARGNCDAATYFQTAGRQGIVSEEGEPFPVFDVLEMFSKYQQKDCQLLESDRPIEVQGILLGNTVAIVNFTDRKREVRFNGEVIEVMGFETKFIR